MCTIVQIQLSKKVVLQTEIMSTYVYNQVFIQISNVL